MDLELSDDQELFRETTARFIDARCPIPRVRELADTPVAHDPALLGEAGELGWFALFVPEELGGGSVSGSPLRDAVIVAEERGRFVQPGPFVATNVVAFALARDGSAEQQAAYLPDLASAVRTASWAISDRSGAPEAGAVQARASGEGYTLTASLGLVPEGTSADVFLVSAADGDGVTQFVVDAGTPGVTVVPLDGLDLTRRFADVHFDDVAVARGRGARHAGRRPGEHRRPDRRGGRAHARRVGRRDGATRRDHRRVRQGSYSRSVARSVRSRR